MIILLSILKYWRQDVSVPWSPVVHKRPVPQSAFCAHTSLTAFPDATQWQTPVSLFPPRDKHTTSGLSVSRKRHMTGSPQTHLLLLCDTLTKTPVSRPQQTNLRFWFDKQTTLTSEKSVQAHLFLFVQHATTFVRTLKIPYPSVGEKNRPHSRWYGGIEMC